jgi:hypothetical protein
VTFLGAGINTPKFTIPVTLHTYSPMKIEQTECSETLAVKLQTPINHPEESIRYSCFLVLYTNFKAVTVLYSLETFTFKLFFFQARDLFAELKLMGYLFSDNI